MHYLIVVIYALQGKQLCKCFYLPDFGHVHLNSTFLSVPLPAETVSIIS